MTIADDAGLTVEGAPPIAGLRFRRPRGDDTDYAAQAILIGASCAQDGIPWRPTAAQLRVEVEHALDRLDPAQDAILAEIDGVLVASAEVERVMRDGVAVFHTGGIVAPSHRRRGLGRAMLHRNVARAVERAALEPPDQPVALGAFAEDSETGHRALLEAEGFEPIRYFFLMRRDLARPIPDAPLPEGLVVRPMEPDQARAVFDAEVEAFMDHWGARTKTDDEFRLTLEREEYDPSLWVVAWDGDQVAGVVQNWIWPTENEELGVRRGWLEHISVRRPWRRRGLARAMTALSLRRFRDMDLDDAMLGVDAENPTGALGLYEGLGFTVSNRSTAYRRDLIRP